MRKRLFYITVLITNIAIALGTMSAGIVHADPHSGLTIHAIRVTGNQNVKAFLILRFIKSKVGDPVNDTQLGHDVRAVETMGLFRQVGPFRVTSFSATQVDLTLPVLERAIVTHSAASDETSVAQEIQSAYDRIDAAFTNHDVTLMFAEMAPDYTFVGQNGFSMNLKHVRDSTQQQLDMVPETMIEITKVESVKLHGNSATVRGSSRLLTQFVDVPSSENHNENEAAQPPDKALIGEDETFQSVWNRTSAGWKLRRSIILTGDQTIDGKVFSSQP